ncbi:MAG TPA: ribosome recycling factor [Alphaproteobacteria bacterium]|nr:ribosome recycling factor [Alphaproteobacteria bacterium]
MEKKMADARLVDYNKKMATAIEVFSKDLNGLRTGRASSSLLDPIKIESYGSYMPISQIATVSVPEARMLTVQVWDRGMVKAVEKALRESGLGLNPAVDGSLIRIPIPALNEERRQELCKIAAKYAEDTRINVRNVRRDGMDKIKKMLKDKEVSEDEQDRLEKEVQSFTDENIKKIDDLLAVKQKEIMNV